jgi:hypothetical protein
VPDELRTQRDQIMGDAGQLECDDDARFDERSRKLVSQKPAPEKPE